MEGCAKDVTESAAALRTLRVLRCAAAWRADAHRSVVAFTPYFARSNFCTRAPVISAT
jgi:hypothetical protein